VEREAHGSLRVGFSLGLDRRGSREADDCVSRPAKQHWMKRAWSVRVQLRVSGEYVEEGRKIKANGRPKLSAQ
jgi:hypothetical protein